jgi:hypothetical protein
MSVDQLEEQVDDSCDPNDTSSSPMGETFTNEEFPQDQPPSNRALQSGEIIRDVELERLYHELADIKAMIFSRWSVLFASIAPFPDQFRSQRDDEDDDTAGESTFDSQLGFSPVNGSPSTKQDITNKQKSHQTRA